MIEIKLADAISSPAGSFQTRREYIPVGSGAAFMRHTVFHNPAGLLIRVLLGR